MYIYNNISLRLIYFGAGFMYLYIIYLLRQNEKLITLYKVRVIMNNKWSLHFAFNQSRE